MTTKAYNCVQKNVIMHTWPCGRTGQMVSRGRTDCLFPLEATFPQPVGTHAHFATNSIGRLPRLSL